MGKYLNMLKRDFCGRWSGLLVEPNPAAFEKLKMKRRKTHNSPACLSPLPRLRSKMQIPVNIHSHIDCENNVGDVQIIDCLEFV